MNMRVGTVHLAVDGAVARITLSNPSRYNAMSLAMWISLADSVATINADPNVRVVLLQGEGEKGFVSGADISEFENRRNSTVAVKSYDEAVAGAITTLTECPIPVVARIHGVCMGGGMSLASACDLRYSARSARFRMPAARLGLGYSAQGMRRMVEILGAARAADIFYTARSFDGVEAERIGFVHAAYDDAKLDEAVEHTVVAIVENAPLTIRTAKLAIRHSLPSPDEQHVRSIDLAVQTCFESADYVEGRQAFMEKRPPRFIGR
jgi:enoyl-CoA hydratase/carnithine racemase